jgi:hypothetical protein
MARYRLIEIRDKLINPDGKPFWKVEKHLFNLFWTEYFGVHSYEGATFYDKEEAETWYNYYVNKKSVREIKVIAQNK